MFCRSMNVLGSLLTTFEEGSIFSAASAVEKPWLELKIKPFLSYACPIPWYTQYKYGEETSQNITTSFKVGAAFKS